MNEKINFRIVAVLVVIAVLHTGAEGFVAGRGNTLGSLKLERTNRELNSTVGSLRAELDKERAITGRLRSEQVEERSIIRAALGACRSAGEGIQGVIAKMEILNGLIRDLERRAGGDGDIPGSE